MLFTSVVKVTQSCPALCDPMDYTVHGILQARVLEWVAFPFSGDLPDPGIEPRSLTLLADSLPTTPIITNYHKIRALKQHRFTILPGAGAPPPGKGHEEGGSAYAKVGSSLRCPRGNSRASTPKTRVCLLSALCFHLHL